MPHFRVFACSMAFFAAALEAQTQISADGDFFKWAEHRFLNSPFAIFAASKRGLSVVTKGHALVVLDGDLNPRTMVGQQESGYRFVVRAGQSASIGSDDVGLTIVSITVNGVQAFGCEELAGLERGPFGEEGTRTYSAFRISGHELIDIPEAEAWDPLMAALGRPKQPTPTEALKIKSAHGANRTPGSVPIGEAAHRGLSAAAQRVLGFIVTAGFVFGVAELIFLLRRLKRRNR